MIIDYKFDVFQLSNHDNPRVATRSDPMLVDGLHMIQHLLPGTSVTYYGDELGLIDTNVRWDQTVDPAGLNVGPFRYLKFSRDPARTPFPWDSSINAGKIMYILINRICFYNL